MYIVRATSLDASPTPSMSASKHVGCVEPPVETKLLRVNVDLQKLRVRREQARAAHREAVVDALAHDQEEIGLPKSGLHGVIECRIGIAETERMIVRDRPARHRNRIKRKRSVLHESAQRVFGSRPPDAAARDHDGALGSA